MTQFIFDNPEHAGGGCIFDNPTNIMPPVDIDRSRAVFDGPIHANGGCIFDDPFQIHIVDERVKGGGGPGPGADRYRRRILQEDEDILAVIIAATYTFH